MPFAIVLDAGHDIPPLFGEIRHAVDAIDDVSERIALMLQPAMAKLSGAKAEP